MQRVAVRSGRHRRPAQHHPRHHPADLPGRVLLRPRRKHARHLRHRQVRTVRPPTQRSDYCGSYNCDSTSIRRPFDGRSVTVTPLRDSLVTSQRRTARFGLINIVASQFIFLDELSDETVCDAIIPTSKEEGYIMRSFWTGNGVVLGCARTCTLI